MQKVLDSCPSINFVAERAQRSLHVSHVIVSPFNPLLLVIFNIKHIDWVEKIKGQKPMCQSRNKKPTCGANMLCGTKDGDNSNGLLLKSFRTHFSTPLFSHGATISPRQQALFENNFRLSSWTRSYSVTCKMHTVPVHYNLHVYLFSMTSFVWTPSLIFFE